MEGMVPVVRRRVVRRRAVHSCPDRHDDTDQDQDAPWHTTGEMVGAVVHGKGSAAPPVVVLAAAASCLELDQDQDQDQDLVREDDEREEASDVSMMAPLGAIILYLYVAFDRQFSRSLSKTPSNSHALASVSLTAIACKCSSRQTMAFVSTPIDNASDWSALCACPSSQRASSGAPSDVGTL